MPIRKGNIAKDLFEDVVKKLRESIASWVLVALGALLGMGLPLLRGLWRSFLGIDPDVGRQAVFFLSVALFFVAYIARGWRLPIKVNPLHSPGLEALVEVKNFGPKATFYASVEFLDAEEDHEPYFRPMTLEPRWDPLGYGSATLRRNEVGKICLASHLEQKDLVVQFSDTGGKGQIWRWRPQHGPGLLTMVRLTISREEKTSQFWPAARPFSALLVMTGWGEGGLSVRFAKLKRRHWWRRPVLRLSSLRA